MKIIIRETADSDLKDVLEIQQLAFGSNEEARLVADILKDPSAEPVLSLLAIQEHNAIGHILFSRMYAPNNFEGLLHILAPLAVVPESQSQGIGGELIRRGLDILKNRGTELVFVLGHPEYYPKYGFIPDAESHGFLAPYQIPKEHANAWMVAKLSDQINPEHPITLRCCDALNEEKYWSE